MKYKLFIADFDFTLGTMPDVIEQDTVSAIKEYVRRGGKFVICSGRMYRFIKAICKKYDLDGLVVTYQGAMINDVSTDKQLQVGGIDYTLASKVVSDLIENGIDPLIFIDDNLYYGKMTSYVDGYIKIARSPGVEVGDLSKFVLDTKKSVLKVGGVGDVDAIQRIRLKFNQLYNGQLLFNNGAPQIIEGINPEYSKGSAVRFLSEYYNIPFEETLAVGDSTNDVELIRGDWFGVAVGDGHEEVKKVAKEITVPFKEQPVKVLLEKYCL